MPMEIPEHLRTGPMAEAAQKALQDAASMAVSSNSVPRLSFRGREFHLTENGEEVAKFRDFLDIIILGVEPEPGMMIKTFYANGYSPGVKEPPDCSSDDGIAPSPWVSNKQAASCKACSKNQFGSATSPTGKPTKACRDSKRIWFRLADSNLVPDGPGKTKPYEVKPFADRTLYGANITVASLKSFADHGRQLTGLGQPPCVCVTRMIMADSEFPQVEFQLHAWLGVEDAPLALEQSEKRPWKIQYKNAGLALAAPDGGARSSLPTSLPGVPAHLQKPAPTQDGNVLDGAVTEVKEATPMSTKEIDDAVGGW